MSDKITKSPEIRFTEYTDAWEQCKLGEVLVKNSMKNKDLVIENVESVSNKTGFTKQTEQFDDYSVASADLSNYYVIKEKQFAYNPSRINVGSIAYKAEGEEKSVVSPLYVSFSTTHRLEDSYLWNWFKTSGFERQRQKLSEGGVRDTLSFNQLVEMYLLSPNKEEQQKIGAFFHILDNLITLNQSKYDKLVIAKKTLQEKMFPKDGANVPEIQFTGFTGAWEQRKFKDFISKAGKKNTMGGNYIAYSVSNKLGLVSQTEQFEGSRLDDLDKTSYKLVNPNEFAYNPARINVGSIAFNNLNTTVIVSSLYVVIKMSDKLDNEFILQFIKSQFFLNEVRRNTEGSVREYLFFESFKNIKFPYTSSKEEQIKIGEFFKQLDELITLHQRELNLLKNLKKSLLQQMFI